MVMKYVRHKTKGVFLFPITSEHVSHEEVATFLGRDGVISAGLVQFSEENVAQCFGESESLDLGGLPDDSMILNRQMLPV